MKPEENWMGHCVEIGDELESPKSTVLQYLQYGNTKVQYLIETLYNNIIFHEQPTTEKITQRAKALK